MTFFDPSGKQSIGESTGESCRFPPQERIAIRRMTSRLAAGVEQIWADHFNRAGYHDRMWPDANETRALLDRAKSGQGGAADELLSRHREALRRAIALRLDPALARRADASDIVQDGLLEAHQRVQDCLKIPTS